MNHQFTKLCKVRFKEGHVRLTTPFQRGLYKGDYYNCVLTDSFTPLILTCNHGTWWQQMALCKELQPFKASTVRSDRIEINFGECQ